MDDYKNHPEITTAEIAKRHGVSAGTLTIWVNKARANGDKDIKLRGRGRRAFAVPTPRQRKIIEMSKVLRQEKVGKRFGLTKQSVSRILKRWEHWKGETIFFRPGDIILWKAKEYIVISATKIDGTLRDEAGNLYKHFTWAGGVIPKKIGVDQRYVIKKSAA